MKKLTAMFQALADDAAVNGMQILRNFMVLVRIQGLH